MGTSLIARRARPRATPSDPGVPLCVRARGDTRDALIGMSRCSARADSRRKTHWSRLVRHPIRLRGCLALRVTSSLFGSVHRRGPPVPRRRHPQAHTHPAASREHHRSLTPGSPTDHRRRGEEAQSPGSEGQRFPHCPRTQTHLNSSSTVTRETTRWTLRTTPRVTRVLYGEPRPARQRDESGDRTERWTDLAYEASRALNHIANGQSDSRARGLQRPGQHLRCCAHAHPVVPAVRRRPRAVPRLVRRLRSTRRAAALHDARLGTGPG